MGNMQNKQKYIIIFAVSFVVELFVAWSNYAMNHNLVFEFVVARLPIGYLNMIPLLYFFIQDENKQIFTIDRFIQITIHTISDVLATLLMLYFKIG